MIEKKPKWRHCRRGFSKFILGQAMAKKLGLVLEGGGGKGAYQLGVLKAFAARDLRFDCVAGTSVGGLNAALWAADKLAEGEKLWFNINQDKIYPWRRPRWFGHLLMLILVPLNVTINYVRGSMSLPTGRKSKITVRIVLGVLIVLMVQAGVYANGMLSLLPLGLAMVLLQAFFFLQQTRVCRSSDRCLCWHTSFHAIDGGAMEDFRVN
jgi:hypothetical protein